MAPLTTLAEVVLLFGGTVHTLVPGEAPRVADLLVEDGRIAAVGTDLEAPPGAERVDCTGRHLVPGLVDAYVSFDPAHDAFYLAAGVTCVRDAGGEQLRLLTEALPEARERTPGPALVTAGAVLDGEPPATPTAGVVRNADQAHQLVSLLAENGADYVSIHANLGPEAHAAIVEVAHERGLEVWGARPRAVSPDEALAAGQDGFFGLDAFLDGELAWTTREGAEALDVALDARARELGARGAGVVPLLAATAARLAAPSTGLGERVRWLDEDYEVWWRGDWEARRRLVEDAELIAFARGAVPRQGRFARTLLEAGADLLPGSGAPNPWLFPGEALHEELAAWTAAGLAPEVVLARATREAARRLGQEEERGRLVEGLVADLLVLEDDPREDLAALRRPAYVAVRGRVLDRVTLDDLVETARVESLARRAAKSAELEVPPLDLPEGAVVLTGLVHTLALERTVTAERFAVVRAPDGSTIHVARVVYPAESGVPRTLDLSQTIDGKGHVVAFDVRVASGDDVLTAEGLIVAGMLRVRRRLNELPVKIDGTRERVRALDLGSVTTALALGQLEEEAQFPVLVFGETLEPQVANWAMERDARGVWQLTTHRGRMAFQLDEVGAPTQVQVAEGRVLRTTLLDEADAFGGSGLPPRRSERPAAPAPDGEGPTEGPAPDGESPTDGPAPEDGE